MGDPNPHLEYPSYWNPKTKSLMESLWKKTAETILNDPVIKQHLLFSWVSVGNFGEPFYPTITNYGTGNPKAFMQHFFAYDQYAQAKFRSDMRTKYGTITDANTAWNTSFSGWTLVVPPRPGQYTEKYWQDFLQWYRDEKVNYVTWAVDIFKKYTDRPFYSTGIADFYSQAEWNHIVQNKGVSSCPLIIHLLIVMLIIPVRLISVLSISEVVLFQTNKRLPYQCPTPFTYTFRIACIN